MAAASGASAVEAPGQTPAAAVVSEADVSITLERAGLLALGLSRSGTSIDQIAAIDRALLPYAQICDARGERPEPADFDAVITDAIDLREQCGEGVLPLAAMVAALPENIPLSIELRSAALREAFAHPALRARAVLDATRSWLDGLT